MRDRRRLDQSNLQLNLQSNLVLFTQCVLVLVLTLNRCEYVFNFINIYVFIFSALSAYLNPDLPTELRLLYLPPLSDTLNDLTTYSTASYANLT